MSEAEEGAFFESWRELCRDVQFESVCFSRADEAARPLVDLLLADGVKVFGDCAINVAPSADELAQIAVASAHTAKQFGVEPRVAMLSYASGDSNQGALIDTIREATSKAKSLCSEYPIEGPIQFDAAVDADVAAIKYKGSDSEVAGHATVCVFPDLTSGS